MTDLDKLTETEITQRYYDDPDTLMEYIRFLCDEREQSRNVLKQIYDNARIARKQGNQFGAEVCWAIEHSRILH